MRKFLILFPLFLVACKGGEDTGSAARSAGELAVYSCSFTRVDESTSCLPGDPCETVISQIVYTCDDGSPEGCYAITEADGSPRFAECDAFDWSSLDGLYDPDGN